MRAVKKLQHLTPDKGKRGNICVDTIFMIIIMHSFPDIEEIFFFR